MMTSNWNPCLSHFAQLRNRRPIHVGSIAFGSAKPSVEFIANGRVTPYTYKYRSRASHSENVVAATLSRRPVSGPASGTRRAPSGPPNPINRPNGRRRHRGAQETRLAGSADGAADRAPVRSRRPRRPFSPQPATTKQQEREEDRHRQQRCDPLPPSPVRASCRVVRISLAHAGRRAPDQSLS
jgi:hypothetical protein